MIVEANPGSDSAASPISELSLRQVAQGLESVSYLPDEGLVAAVFLAISLKRPLLLEGEAGVGKTEVAKALSAWTGGELIRLQCYEGIGVSQAVYEWDYARQITSLRVREASGKGIAEAPEIVESDLYSERFLVKRPLLLAIRPEQLGNSQAGGFRAEESQAGGSPAKESQVGEFGSSPAGQPATSAELPVPILLIDEIDRADDEFEAFLLEVLSDWSVTVPEIGTFIASQPPICVITSNRTRDIHDALRRRCLYHWVEHPDLEREVAIVTLRSSAKSESLARQVSQAVARLREANFYKPPSVAESIAWANALSAIGADELTEQNADITLGAVLKYREDQDKARSMGIVEFVG